MILIYSYFQVLFIYYEFNGCQRDLARLIQVHQSNEVNLTVSKEINSLIKDSKLPTTENGRLNEANALQLALQMILDYSQQYTKAYIKVNFSVSFIKF